MASSSSVSTSAATKVDSVSFLGAGAMGLPMMERLLSGGMKVTGWNRSADKMNPLLQKYPSVFTTAVDPFSAVAANKIVFIMLSEFGPIQAVFNQLTSAGALRDKVIINTSTINAEETQSLAKQTADGHGIYISSPVLGTATVAAAGKLTVLFSSDDPALFDQYQGLFASLGNPRYIGKLGTASTMKLALNQVLAAQTAAFAFSLGFVEKSGLDTDLFLQLLTNGPFTSPYFSMKYPAMKSRQFEPVLFSTELMLKDVKLVVEQAKRVGVESPMAQGLIETYRMATLNGNAEKDFSSVITAVAPPSSASAAVKKGDTTGH